eukprot:CAMPEP_0194279882 /NCGR_PEP_ID=MMETSP0169-20130528/14177_1 /TAXON_ID=218684 /ORGANISM="Corethron pennatum, Strain L29A3" /LENGTH=500 /DNA_ID=CAMNT_0039024363 /DNA_START=30 /DNA_END=1532 /DNA_ORIENTATION=-
MSDKNDIGLFGLAVMGQNFALNMASHGFKVGVSNRSEAKIGITVARAKAEDNLPLEGYNTGKELCESLKSPKVVVILVQAGKPVDSTIAMLSEHMSEGDIIVDGGNEWYPNQTRRHTELGKKGIRFVGMGISGGEEGARNGPSLMPGCDAEAWEVIRPIMEACAAKVPNPVEDGPEESCTGYLGPIGAGNYVKMVHNGIEYGDMQLIAEAYDVLKNIVGMTNPDMSRVFSDWNSTELDSYLIEITSKILSKKDDLAKDSELNAFVLDRILDKTGSKGTGRWTVQEAAEQSVACPTIAAALDARYLSSRKDERVAASSVLTGPAEIPSVAHDQIVEDLAAAIYCSKLVCYAQGMGLIRAASDKFGWGVDLALCARLWRGGCIIRAGLLGKIQSALATNKNLANLMIDPKIAAELNSRHRAWRRIVTLCVASGMACPALSASLGYYDTYRRAALPANLTQAQRDYFGGHTYERTDREGPFHCQWTDDHKDIGDVTTRTAGEN